LGSKNRRITVAVQARKKLVRPYLKEQGGGGWNKGWRQSVINIRVHYMFVWRCHNETYYFLKGKTNQKVSYMYPGT
jgi:hypothetical protein